MILKNNLKIINKDFRNYYRNVTKNDKKIRLHEYDNDRIIQLFTKKVAKNIIESKSGVHIKRLGYFYNHRIPWIIFPIKTKKHAYKYITSFIFEISSGNTMQSHGPPTLIVVYLDIFSLYFTLSFPTISSSLSYLFIY